MADVPKVSRDREALLAEARETARILLMETTILESDGPSTVVTLRPLDLATPTMDRRRLLSAIESMPHLLRRLVSALEVQAPQESNYVATRYAEYLYDKKRENRHE